MPRVDFYVLPEATSPLRFACEMAARIRREELDLHIQAPSREDAVALDGLLWTFRDISFLPHALADETPARAAPITIGWPGAEPAAVRVLVNLDEAWPAFAGGYERIVEPVPAAADARTASRERFRRYREQGWELVTHNLEQERAES